jgi:hypothetical protein
MFKTLYRLHVRLHAMKAVLQLSPRWRIWSIWRQVVRHCTAGVPMRAEPIMPSSIAASTAFRTTRLHHFWGVTCRHIRKNNGGVIHRG